MHLYWIDGVGDVRPIDLFVIVKTALGDGNLFIVKGINDSVFFINTSRPVTFYCRFVATIPNLPKHF
jgi:hypothetical protein